MGDNFCLFQSFIVDPLHQIELGVFGHHMWPWVLSPAIISGPQQAVLDERFKAIPRFQDLKHFPNGVTEIENMQGKELGIVLRTLPPLIEDLLSTTHIKLICRAFRTLGCIHLLSKSTCHTETTHDALSSLIARFGELSQEIHDKFEDFSNAYPKVHSFVHMVDMFRRKGPSDNYHTGLGEGVHPELKEAYKRTNKQPGFEEQILRIHLEQESMKAVREGLEQAAQASKQSQDETSAIDASVSTQNYDLGSKGRSLLTSEFVDHQISNHPEHKLFERDLKTFLYQNVDGLATRRDFRQQDLPSLEGTKVTPYSLIRISYISLEDAREKVDLVRTNLNWRGTGARYDCVMIQGQEDEGIWFARLLSAFVLEFRGQKIPIAYIRRFRTLPSRSKTTGFIELEDQGVYNFVYVDSLIRAFLLLSPGVHHRRHAVADLVDVDVYFRLFGMD